MKSIDEYINESILDDDFDIDNNVVYATQLKSTLLDLILNQEEVDIDAKFNEVSDLLKDLAKIQREDSIDKSSIMKKMRMKDNTSIWALKVPYPDTPYKIYIHRFIQNPRPQEMCITLQKNKDGTGRVRFQSPYKCNHPSQISPAVAKGIVFMSPEFWDDVVTAYYDSFK